MKWRPLLVFILFLPVVHAIPFFESGFMYVDVFHDEESVWGTVDLSKVQGYYDDGMIVVALVKQTQEGQLGTVDRWVLSERYYPVTSDDFSVEYEFEFPPYAPIGEYFIEAYAKVGRKYAGSYITTASTPARYSFVREMGGSGIVARLNVTETMAENLTGTFGPFVNEPFVNLTLVSTSQPDKYRIVSCKWDDIAFEQGLENEYCTHYTVPGDVSRIKQHLPVPGSYGIRVETIVEDVVTSVSRLRAVRNGTSVRVLGINLKNESVVIELIPSQDRSDDETLQVEILIDNMVITEDVTFKKHNKDDESRAEKITIPFQSVYWGPVTVTVGNSIDMYSRTINTCEQKLVCCEHSRE